MKFLIKYAKKLDSYLIEKIVSQRKPDFTIKYDNTSFYVERWYIIPKNKIFNIYLHQFTKPDPDYELHDHPFFFISFILFSSYTEHNIKYGGVFKFTEHKIGDVLFISPWRVHRISNVLSEICRTLIITGPEIREWGFHSAVKGWVNSKEYLSKQGKDK